MIICAELHFSAFIKLFFFPTLLDQLHVGILTTTNWSIVQVPHFLHACRIKLNNKVEDFYNSHCGGPAVRALPCPVRYRGLFEYAHIHTATKRECFSYLFFNIVRGEAPCSADSKSRASRKEHDDAEWAKTQQGGNSLFYTLPSSSQNKMKFFFQTIMQT